MSETQWSLLHRFLYRSQSLHQAWGGSGELPITAVPLTDSTEMLYFQGTIRNSKSAFFRQIWWKGGQPALTWHLLCACHATKPSSMETNSGNKDGIIKVGWPGYGIKLEALGLGLSLRETRKPPIKHKVRGEVGFRADTEKERTGCPLSTFCLLSFTCRLWRMTIQQSKFHRTTSIHLSNALSIYPDTNSSAGRTTSPSKIDLNPIMHVYGLNNRQSVKRRHQSLLSLKTVRFIGYFQISSFLNFFYNTIFHYSHKEILHFGFT